MPLSTRNLNSEIVRSYMRVFTVVDDGPWILDSNSQRDSRFRRQNFPGIPIPQTKMSQIPESGIRIALHEATSEYTLSDLGDLSNLIGWLSRTVQQYSPPSEWIMCELGFFPIFLEKDLLKVDKILGLTFFQARKDFEGFKTAFFHLLLLSFVVDGLFTTPVYSRRRGRFVNSAFPNKKNLAQKRSLFMTNKFESKCLQKFYVSSKHEKECYMKTTSYLEEPNRHFCQHFMRRTTQQTFSAINLASQQKTTKLFFSSQVRKQFKLLAVPFKSLRCCLRSDKLVNCHV